MALKTLLPTIASDPQVIARFKQEIQLSRRIAHPNVCKVFDVARHPPGSSPAQVILLSMEYLPGETLSKRVERVGRLTAEEALPIVRQMAVALDAAHAAGVIHRDFKTSNVMLVPAGGAVRVVVTDFGLARNAEPHGETTATMPGRIAGTLDYMAPELLAGRPATVASDVYALGMTIRRMLAGTRPFAEDEPLAAAVRRGQEPVPAPRTVVPELDERWDGAVARCLDADPARRFASAGDVVRAIEGEAVGCACAARAVLDQPRSDGCGGRGYRACGGGRIHRLAPASAAARSRTLLSDRYGGPGSGRLFRGHKRTRGSCTAGPGFQYGARTPGGGVD